MTLMTEKKWEIVYFNHVLLYCVVFYYADHAL